MLSKFRSIVLLILSVMVLSDVFATTPKPDPKHDHHQPTQPSTSARADAESYSTSRSTSDATANATGKGGSAEQSQTATGGDGGSSTVDVESSASNEGNAQSVNYSTPRQVPPVFLPALMVSDCGAGANAGASDSGGAGALGIVWTTKRCYALRSAINFFAIGEYETGCKLLAYVNREALRSIDEKPDCKSISKRLYVESQSVSIPLVAAPPADFSKYATKEELDRAFKQSQRK